MVEIVKGSKTRAQAMVDAAIKVFDSAAFLYSLVYICFAKL